MTLDGEARRTRPPGSIQDPDDLSHRLQEMLRALASRRRVHHAIVALERGDRSFQWAGAMGEAKPGGQPIQTDTPFFIASVTKLHLAAVVMKLHGRGQVGLDESISAYLPPELVTGLHRRDGVDHSGAITVRHLLGHTSGLPDYLEERPRGGASLIERLVDDGDRAWDIEEVVRIVRDELSPHFPPQPADADRQRTRYSDTNYQLLIAIIEAVTARPLHEVFEELLFRPLGLHHTWLPGRSGPLEPAGEPASLWFKDEPLELPLAMASFGDLYSTADDTLRFLRALIGGDIFDDEATPGLMQSRWVRFGFPRDRAALRTPGWPIEYGLGIMRFRFRLPRVRTPGRQVPTLVGHSGSTGAWLFTCPQLDLLLSGTVDQATAGAMPFRFLPKLLRVVGRATG